jgi:hypothetical protein
VVSLVIKYKPLLTKLFHTKKGLFRKRAFQHITALFILLCCSGLTANAQYFDLIRDKKHVTIPFRMIRDMVVIKLSINNKGPYNFILDSGVGLMLITEPKLVDSINITSKRTLKIAGLGGEGEEYEAYITSELKIDIPGLVSYDVAAAILKTDHFGLSNFAGMPIHGLLGYEFFNNLAVRFNFSDSTITVSNPRDVRMFKKGNKIPLTIENRKPYLHAKVTFTNGDKVDDKVILDIGAGHPLSLDNIIKKEGLPQKFITANLGVGLTGPIEGFISRIKEVELGRYKIKDVITSFPIDIPVEQTEKRDGNIGMGILKRFNLIIDYPDSALYIKPRAGVNMPFEHDMSGLEYYRIGDNFDHVLISRVEPGSAGDEIGLEKDDEIVAINLKPVSQMTLEEIDAIFRSENDRSLLLDIYHDKKTDRVILTLKRRV